MEISVMEGQTSPFEIDVHLEANEVADLANGAWKRMARILKCDEDRVQQHTEELLTAREIQKFLEETIMACAAEAALEETAPLFMGAPEFEINSPLRNQEPFSFRARVYPVPSMDIDCETPIVRKRPKAAKDGTRRTSSLSDRDLAQETLRARVHGTIPDRLLRRALALKKEQFQQHLADKGLTYREYRIAHRVKPQEVEDELYDEAFDELSTDIALDLVFIKQELAISQDKIDATLAELAPGREKELFNELSATGKTWMLHQKARRNVALDWAVEHLLECQEAASGNHTMK